MKFRKIIVNFFGSFILVLVVSSIVSFLWNLIFHRTGHFDWETSFRLSIIFSIIIPWITSQASKKTEE